MSEKLELAIHALTECIDGLRVDVRMFARDLRELTGTQQRITRDLTSVFKDFAAELAELRRASDRRDRLDERIQALENSVSVAAGGT